MAYEVAKAVGVKIKSIDDIWKYFDNNDHLIITTDDQTLGKGQRGRTWFSKKNKSLIFSVGLMDDKKNSNLIALKVVLATVEAIIKSSKLNPSIKWPNDILINNKKVAGILIESKLNGIKRRLSIGVGINVNLDSRDIKGELESKMTSLNIETNKNYSREQLLSNFIKSLDYFLYKDSELIINKWEKLCAHKNSELQFHDFNNNIINGKFVGIDKTGRAIINSKGKISYHHNGAIEL